MKAVLSLVIAIITGVTITIKADDDDDDDDYDGGYSNHGYL